jgi:hypothetical protein
MVADCDVCTANVRQGYGLAAFREDVKQLYRVRGFFVAAVCPITPVRSVLEFAITVKRGMLWSSTARVTFVCRMQKTSQT